MDCVLLPYPRKNQLIFKDKDLKLKTCLVHFNIPDRGKSKFKNIILKFMRRKLMPVLPPQCRSNYVIMSFSFY